MPKRLLLPLTLLALLPLAACDDDEGTGPGREEFTATLTGSAEVPVRTTTATGTAEFTLNADRTVSYRIDVANLRNLTAGHIHGPSRPDTTGQVLVTLFPVAGGPTSVPLANGRIAEGTFGQAQIGVAGVTLDSLLTLMRNGNSYVNLHTNDGVAPTNTGPGDFPGGEIRGTVRRR